MSKNKLVHDKHLQKSHIVFTVIFLLIVALIIAVIVFRVGLAARGFGKEDQLSDRAREFIAKDTADGEGIWSSTNFSPNSDAIKPEDPESGVTTPCFSLSLPIKTANHSQEQEGLRCTFHAKVLLPLSQLVVSSYPMSSPDEDTGIQLRLKDTEHYQQLPFTPKNYSKVWLFKGEDHMTVFAWSAERMTTISMTGVVQTELLDPAVFEQILNSMTYSENVVPALPSPSPKASPKSSLMPTSTNSATIKKQ